MPFIGNQPALSYTSFAKQDFTTSATTSYTLDNPVANENEIALFINFVRQEPTTAYTASGTSLTLTSATSASDDMYCVFLGKAVQTVNPPNGSVGTAQLADSSVTNDKVASTLITGQTAETSIATDDLILLSDTSASGALKKMTRANFVSGIGGDNTPAFQVLLANTISVSSGTNTVIAFDTEIFDTDNAVSNGVFTVPSGKAGKYFFSVNGGFSTSNDISSVQIWLSKNNQQNITTTSGWAIAIDYFHKGSSTSKQTECVSGTMDLAVGESVKVYIHHNFGSAKNTNTHGRFTFSGHKILT